jgi:hypothetical protein
VRNGEATIHQKNGVLGSADSAEFRGIRAEYQGESKDLGEPQPAVIELDGEEGDDGKEDSEEDADAELGKLIFVFNQMSKLSVPINLFQRDRRKNGTRPFMHSFTQLLTSLMRMDNSATSSFVQRGAVKRLSVVTLIRKMLNQPATYGSM